MKKPAKQASHKFVEGGVDGEGACDHTQGVAVAGRLSAGQGDTPAPAPPAPWGTAWRWWGAWGPARLLAVPEWLVFTLGWSIDDAFTKFPSL